MYLVVDGNFIPLLGCDACLDLEVLEFMNLELITTPESKQPEQEMPSFFQTNPALQDYKDCFSDKPGKLPYKVHLEVDPSVPPVVHPPRKIPFALLEPPREKLTEMEEDGIIVKEEEHTPWVSSMLVIDKRKVKEKITPLSKKEVANRLSGAKSFMSLDACSGYWQLPVDDESSKLLTFNTPWGRYRFTRLPFGAGLGAKERLLLSPM